MDSRHTTTDAWGPAYAHLLGLYLGDGCVSRAPRGVYRLRIALDRKYPQIAEAWPDRLIKGLIQSDGCRFVNSGRNGWRHPRYAFSNVSTDITSIFCSACDCLGLRWSAAFPKRESAAVTIYVSRKADVTKLDQFVGPKR